jgi:NAD(P)-dependent dehydrogenase (short-subunit alcohol dehydrogenase family)
MRSVRSVLITGSSKEIGLATALILVRTGYTVYATMRDPTGSPELADAIDRERLPVKIFAMDVNSDLSVKDTIRSDPADARAYRRSGQQRRYRAEWFG